MNEVESATSDRGPQVYEIKGKRQDRAGLA